MKKFELVAKIAEQTDLTKKDAEATLNVITDIITEALAAGEKVSITGFGSFETRERAAREGRNPRTKQTIHIPARKTPAFKAGKALKEAVQ